MKVIVLWERPADGKPPLLIMGVCREDQTAEVMNWVGDNPRRGYVFTEQIFTITAEHVENPTDKRLKDAVDQLKDVKVV